MSITMYSTVYFLHSVEYKVVYVSPACSGMALASSANNNLKLSSILIGLLKQNTPLFVIRSLISSLPSMLPHTKLVVYVGRKELFVYSCFTQLLLDRFLSSFILCEHKKLNHSHPQHIHTLEVLGTLRDSHGTAKTSENNWFDVFHLHVQVA